MDCPQCRNSEVDASGTCLICGYRPHAEAGEPKVRFRQRRQASGSTAAVEYESPDAQPPGSELPEWRRDLARRLQEIRQKQDLGATDDPPPPTFPESDEPPGVVAEAPARPARLAEELPPPQPTTAEVSAPPGAAAEGAVARVMQPVAANAAVESAAPERPEPPIPRASPTITRRTFSARASGRAASAPPPQDPLPFAPPPPRAAARRAEPASGAPPRARAERTAIDSGAGIESLIDRIVARQTPVAPTIPDAPLPPPITYPDLPAEPGRMILLSRTLAGLIDLVIVFLCGTSFVLAAELVSGIVVFDVRSWIHYALLLVAIFFVYSIFFLEASGQTIGMMIADLSVVTVEHTRPSTRAILERSALYLAGLLPLGAGLIAGIFDAEARCLHDRYSGTQVVRVAWPDEIADSD